MRPTGAAICRMCRTVGGFQTRVEICSPCDVELCYSWWKKSGKKQVDMEMKPIFAKGFMYYLLSGARCLPTRRFFLECQTRFKRSCSFRCLAWYTYRVRTTFTYLYLGYRGSNLLPKTGIWLTPPRNSKKTKLKRAVSLLRSEEPGLGSVCILFSPVVTSRKLPEKTNHCLGELGYAQCILKHFSQDCRYSFLYVNS